MYQPTSILAWRREIQPHLGERQEVVLEALKGDMTNLEIAEKLGVGINTITPRIFELRKMKLVRESHKRKCKISGRTAIAWMKNNGSLF